MSKMVSARIPDAVYDQVNSQLRSLGFSPSELINAAFEYFLSERKMPESSQSPAGQRKLGKEDVERLRKFIQSSTLNIEISPDVKQDKRIVRESKVAKYEALA